MAPTNMQRIGKNATSVRTESGVTRVKYHDTIVVAWYRTKLGRLVRLRHGGQPSRTAMVRMNQTANVFELGFHVVQLGRSPDWEVIRHFDGARFPFYDGILLNVDTGGRPTRITGLRV